MNVYCITCRSPLAVDAGLLPTPPHDSYEAINRDECVLVACVGGCGRSELFPFFLQVGLYYCTECTALILELSRERNFVYEQESQQASQPAHSGDRE